MITVYYKSESNHWRYDLSDDEHAYIIKSLTDDKIDIQEMFEESLEILRDSAELDEDEMDEDEQIDQTVAIAFLWEYFNKLAPEDERIQGDIALIEEDDGEGVTILPASALIEEDEEEEG
jgi:hypothetical protein